MGPLAGGEGEATVEVAVEAEAEATLRPSAEVAIVIETVGLLPMLLLWSAIFFSILPCLPKWRVKPSNLFFCAIKKTNVVILCNLL